MYRFVFFDTDDTLLDFRRTEAHAIGRTFAALGLDPTPELIARYSAINQSCWERFERGELTRAETLLVRFRELFAELGVKLSPEACEDIYRQELSVPIFFVEGAEEAVRRLSHRYRLYIASNGMARTQDTRLANSGLRPYFEEVFLSERIGAHKPEPAFFEACFAKIPDFRREQAIIIGDSLTSDILGGIRAGIDTCWLNLRHHAPRADIVPTYTIEKLSELIDILP